MSLFIAVVAPVQAAQVVLEVDTTRPRVGQTIGLHLTVVDGASSRPDLPDIPGLEVIPADTNVGMSIINFKKIKTVTYSWRVTPTTSGSIGIPAVTLDVDGVTANSNALRLSVSEGADADSGEVLEVSLSDDDGRIWVGQTLVYELSFRTPSSMYDRRWTPPTFDGMVSEQTGQRAVREFKAAYDDEPFQVVEVSEPLVVTSAGRWTITPSVFTVQYPVKRQRRDPMRDMGFGSMFVDTRTEVFTSDVFEIEATPLPLEGRDDALWTGLVGSYVISATPSDTSIAMGESMTLDVRILGDGTLSGFALPEQTADGYRSYDDAAEIKAVVEEGRFITQGDFRRAIVPEAEGMVTVAPIELQVFDPTSGEYVVVATEPFELMVTPGEANSELESFSSGDIDARRDVRELGEDILPIHAAPSTRSEVFSFLGAPLALIGLPWLAFLGLVGRDLRTRFAPQVDPRVALRAQVAAIGDVASAETAFRAVLAWKLGIPPAAVERGLCGDIEGADALYKDLEAARYGGAGADLSAQVRAFCDGLLA
ncbi:MAG: protein BatD [Proteobacteria bacterium]|nr:protein BatD [Pseudomonadota bacterium]MCP4921799.1 protein BatD [Pseudomonadota bacterium]